MMNTSALAGELETAFEKIVEGIEKASHVLYELKKRGETHAMMSEGPCKYYADVATGKMTAREALDRAGEPNLSLRELGKALND